MRQLNATSTRQVTVEFELLFQFQRLEASVGLPASSTLVGIRTWKDKQQDNDTACLQSNKDLCEHLIRTIVLKDSQNENYPIIFSRVSGEQPGELRVLPFHYLVMIHGVPELRLYVAICLPIRHTRRPRPTL